ncbi:MAG: zf-HC2 domain-containing protein [Candidatus Krumholzibacteriia bacterium]
MSGQHSGQAPHLSCGECRQRLQDYLDDGLERRESMQVYLHVRDCEDCAAQAAALAELVAQLESLPDHAAPADFDARVLASVPYDSYRAMAALRAPRVPVFLERDALPAWLRQPAVRAGGLALAAAAAAGKLGGLEASTLLAAAMLVGVVPEALIRLQALARSAARAIGHAREGA